MNNPIGPIRTSALVVLAALNVGVFALNNFFLHDMNAQMRREHNAIKNETLKLQNEANDLREGSEELKKMADIYTIAKDRGFINDQNRVTVRDSFNILAGVTNLLKADYKVERAQQLENEGLSKAGYVILKSNVEVEIEALDDVKIYNFVYLLTNKFPGITNLKRVQVKREQDITLDTLKVLEKDPTKEMVRGYVNFDWVSVAPVEGVSGG